jgi:hypothetical protein
LKYEPVERDALLPDTPPSGGRCGERGAFEEAFMKKILLSACLAVAATPCLAFEREVDNIWWAVYDNYNFTGQTACIAESYYDHPVRAVFWVYPVPNAKGAPVATRTVVTLMPFQDQKIWSWEPASGPGPRCGLHAILP